MCDTIKYIKQSLYINYKSWILLIIAIYILNRNNLLYGMITFLFMLNASYFFHEASHKDTVFNLVHLYHHAHDNMFSHIIEIFHEFTTFLLFIPIKYFLNIFFIDYWIVLFYYIFYTTVHNINYSIFHVNNVHKNHHILKNMNLGPDICDIMFQTKFDYENSIENTDHYIWNIIGSFTIVYILKSYYELSTINKDCLENMFNIIFSSSLIIYILIALYVVYGCENPCTNKKPYFSETFLKKTKVSKKERREKLKKRDEKQEKGDKKQQKRNKRKE